MGDGPAQMAMVAQQPSMDYDPVCGVIYLYGVYCTCAGALESQAKHPTRLPGSFRQ